MTDDSILMYVQHGCSCESYYGYVCGLCRALRDQHEDFKRLLDAGLIWHDEKAETYHTRWKLTSKGRQRYDEKFPPVPITWSNEF